MGNEDLTSAQIYMLKQRGELDDLQTRIFIHNMKRQAEAKWGPEKKPNNFSIKEVKENGKMSFSFIDWFNNKFEKDEYFTIPEWKKALNSRQAQIHQESIRPEKKYKSHKLRLAAWVGALVTSAIIVLSPNLDYISKSFQGIENYFAKNVQTQVYKPNVFPEPPQIPLNSPPEAFATVEQKENTYVVQKGDTMEGFAKKYGVDPIKDKEKMNEFYKINGKEPISSKWVNPDGSAKLFAKPLSKNPNYNQVGAVWNTTPLIEKSEKKYKENLEEKVVLDKSNTKPVLSSHPLDKVVDDYIRQLSSRRMS